MIDRRDFLKIGGLFSVAMLTGIGSVIDMTARSVEMDFNGLSYRGTADGNILVSSDSGKTWSLHTQFGPHLSVSRLYVDLRRRMVAVLNCQGYDFKLALSSDLRTWWTV